MYLVSVINSLVLGQEIWTPANVMNTLLDENIWAFSHNAPNLRYLSEGDRIVVYLAGRGNRAFAADFSVASQPYEETFKDTDSSLAKWLVLFPIRISVRDTNIWSKTLSISEVLGDLDFITDKRNYGLFFRQSTKVIGEKDFLKIVKASSR